MGKGDLEKKIEKLKLRKKQLIQKRDFLQAQINQLQNQLATQNIQSHQTIKGLRVENQKLRDQIQILVNQSKTEEQQSIQERNLLQAQINQLQNQLAAQTLQSNQTNQGLSVQLENSQRQVNILNERIQDADITNQDLEITIINTLREDLQRTTLERQELTNIVQEQQNQIDNLLIQNNQVQQQLVQEREQFEQINQTLLNQILQEQEKNQNQINDLRNQLEQSQNILTQAHDVNEQLKKENKQYIEEQDKLLEKNKNLEDKLQYFIGNQKDILKIFEKHNISKLPYWLTGVNIATIGQTFLDNLESQYKDLIQFSPSVTLYGDEKATGSLAYILEQKEKELDSKRHAPIYTLALRAYPKT